MTLDRRHQHRCPACSELWDCETEVSDCTAIHFAICEDCETAEAIALTLLGPGEEASVV